MQFRGHQAAFQGEKSTRTCTSRTLETHSGTCNEFIDYAPLVGLYRIAKLNMACGFHSKRENPYCFQLLRRQHTLDNLLRADTRADTVKAEPQQHSHIMRGRWNNGIVNACLLQNITTNPAVNIFDAA